MMRNCTGLVLYVAAGLALLTGAARAEPYLAIQQGYKCIACHVNPTGGGLRNTFGTVFAENVMPAAGLPEGVPVWSGGIGEFLRLGGDLRASGTHNEVPYNAAQHSTGVDQLRVYADVAVIPNRLDLYVDEALAPGNARYLEAYARLTGAAGGWYLKGGQFYLPFGWRLQDQSAFVREVSGISMTTPDSGVELGFERPNWSAQLDLTNGAANIGTGSGQQVTGQVVWVQSRYRVGAAASFWSVFRQIGVHDIRVPLVKQFVHFLNRISGAPPRPAGVSVRLHVRLENRLTTGTCYASACQGIS